MTAAGVQSGESSRLVYRMILAFDWIIERTRMGADDRKVSMAREPMTENYRLPKASSVDAVGLRSGIELIPWIRTIGCRSFTCRLRP